MDFTRNSSENVNSFVILLKSFENIYSNDLNMFMDSKIYIYQVNNKQNIKFANLLDNLIINTYNV